VQIIPYLLFVLFCFTREYLDDDRLGFLKAILHKLSSSLCMVDRILLVSNGTPILVDIYERITRKIRFDDEM